MQKNAPHNLYENVGPQENDFPLKFRTYRSRTFLPHWHEHIELLYFVEGGGTVTLDGVRLAVGAGDLVVVNSTEIHTFESAGERACYHCVLVAPSFFSDTPTGRVTYESLVRADGEVADCFAILAREHAAGGIGADMMQKGALYRLFVHLCRAYGTQPAQNSERRLMLTRFNSVMQHVAAHYAEPLTTRALAEMCYLSEGHFCRFFKAATGQSPLSYVNSYRIDRAAILLRRTDSSITEVALATGFSDVNYFARVFRRVKGCSPGEYRRAAMGDLVK